MQCFALDLDWDSSCEVGGGIFHRGFVQGALDLGAFHFLNRDSDPGPSPLPAHSPACDATRAGLAKRSLSSGLCRLCPQPQPSRQSPARRQLGALASHLPPLLNASILLASLFEATSLAKVTQLQRTDWDLHPTVRPPMHTLNSSVAGAAPWPLPGLLWAGAGVVRWQAGKTHG